MDVRVVVVDEGEVGVDEGQCVEHGKDPFAVPRLKYLPFVLFPLGVPSSPKSVVFLNIVQKAFDPPPPAPFVLNIMMQIFLMDFLKSA